MFEEIKGHEQELPAEVRGQIPPEVLSLLRQAAELKKYNFASSNKAWTVTLSRGFIALTTKDYSTWRDFYGRFERPLDTLIKLYSPIHFTRVGLRYQNVIRRSRLGLEGVSWSELLSEHIAGIYAAPDFDRERIQGTRSVAEIQLNDDCGIVRLNYGTVQNSSSAEVGYLLDSDFFVENIGTGDKDHVITRLAQFNQKAARLFRWCISEQLHAAMGPTEH